MGTLATALDLLLPRRCAVCGRSGEQLCDRCLAALPRLSGPRCARCGAPAAWPVVRCRECAGRRLAFASARAALAYDDSVARLVAAWKERGLRRLAAPLADLVAEALPRPEASALAFVPPDADRSRRRGHHPAGRLALELGVRWELPAGRYLTRAGSRRRQAGLPLAARRRNARGAFAPSRTVPARVVLVDDVYTSGATAAAAASALRAGGARRVEVVTLARAVR